MSSTRGLECDTCGKPATQLARDIKEERLLLNLPNAQWRTYESVGIKLGCDEHPVKSIRYDEHGNVKPLDFQESFGQSICETMARFAEERGKP